MKNRLSSQKRPSCCLGRGGQTLLCLESRGHGGALCHPVPLLRMALLHPSPLGLAVSRWREDTTYTGSRARPAGNRPEHCPQGRRRGKGTLLQKRVGKSRPHPPGLKRAGISELLALSHLTPASRAPMASVPAERGETRAGQQRTLGPHYLQLQHMLSTGQIT